MTDAESRARTKRIVADFLELAAQTIEAVRAAENCARLVTALDEALGETESVMGEDVELLRKALASGAATARSGIESEFALLRSNSLMGLWGALEACIDDIAIVRLAATEGACAQVEIARAKVNLGEYMDVDLESRWPWILEQLKRHKSSMLKSGVGQFENILSCVGLDGPVDEDLRRAIFYTKAVRNLVAHKAGRVDAKFMADCPKIVAQPGTPLVITHAQLQAAIAAMIVYVQLVRDRAMAAAGKPGTSSPLPNWVGPVASLPEAFEAASESSS